MQEYTSDEKSGKTAEDLINWMDLTSSTYWQVSLNEVNIGFKQITLNYNNVVLDSGSSLIYIPSSDYSQVFSAVTSDTPSKCSSDSSSGITYCTCTSISDSSYPNMTIRLGGRYVFFFNSTDYLTWDSTKKKCILSFLEDSSGATKFWLLGDPFMRAYYIIHDMDNLKVGLAGKRVDLGVDAAVGGISSSNTSSNNDNSDPFTGYIMYIIIGVGSFLVLLILMCIISRCCGKKRQNRSSEAKVLNLSREVKDNSKSAALPPPNKARKFPNDFIN